MKYTEPFLKVYDHYPLKKGKYQAQKTWTKIYHELPSEDELIAAIEAQKKERKWLRSQNRFVPPWKHFSTWLNAGCWEDVCLTPEKPKARVHSYTINTLHRAYNVLINFGHDKFEEFCVGVGMCDGDKEAVLNKYNCAFPPIDDLTKGIG